jgi:hypothetical protein
VLESDQSLMLVHAGATDAMLHLRGDKAVLDVLLELDGRLTELRRRHAESGAGELRIVMLSDHGNTKIKVRSADGVRKKLKKAGLRPWPQLERPGDVVAATFGILNYGVLFTLPENGEQAARAMVEHRTVALAAWRSGEQEVGVAGKSGKGAKLESATVRWRDAGGRRTYGYFPTSGDPLRLAPALEAMRAAGLVDEAGYAGEQAWLDASVDSIYPNAPRRLIDGLAGGFVANAATVIFSLEPGYGWGWQSAYASSLMWGGRLEGTHGGLDRDSSLGFFMSDRALPGLPAVLSVTDVLVPFAQLERGTPESRITRHERQGAVEPAGH